jgi:hypothetical protein
MEKERHSRHRGLDGVTSPTPAGSVGTTFTASGTCDSTIEQVRVEIRTADDRHVVANGVEQQAGIAQGNWSAPFSSVPTSAGTYYRLKVSFYETGNILATLITIRITVS